MLLGAIAFKLYNFILPYRNVDKASRDFLNIDTVTDYKLIKHYYDRTGTFVTRPIFAVDIEYTEDVYRQKKTEEINGRTVYKEFEISDYDVIIVSAPNEPMEFICFCDELNIIRYIKVFNEKIDESEDEAALGGYLYSATYIIGCKWSPEEYDDDCEAIPEAIMWTDYGKAD